jgi:hypothetical protein
MQCACAILSYVAYPALPHFVTLSDKRHNFFWGGEVIKCQVCFDFLNNLSLKHLLFYSILTKDAFRDPIHRVLCSYLLQKNETVKCPFHQ